MFTGIKEFFKKAPAFFNIRFNAYFKHGGENRIFLNEHYTESKNKRQTYDLVFPKNTSGDMGLVLCIHGGAWIIGSKDSYTGSLFQVSERKGVAAACMNYRYASDKVGFDDIINDISAALSGIKAKGAKYGVNFDRVLLTGISAGGHLSLLYAYTQKETAPIKPACVVELCGPTDLENPFFYAPENGLNGAGNKDFTRDIVINGIRCAFDPDEPGSAREALKKYSPVNFVDENTVPTVLGHGEQDTLVPYGNSLDLNARLEAFNVSVARIIRTRFILEISTRLLRYTPSEYVSIPRSYALQPNTSFQNKIFDLKSSNFVRLQGNGSRKAVAFQ